MGKKIEVKYLSASEFELWSDFVEKSPDGSIYSAAEYLDILCEATGGHYKILAAFQGNDRPGECLQQDPVE